MNKPFISTFLIFLVVVASCKKEKGTEDKSIKDQIVYTQLDESYSITSNTNFQLFPNECGSYIVPSNTTINFEIDLDNDNVKDLQVGFHSLYVYQTSPFDGLQYVMTLNQIKLKAISNAYWISTIPYDSIRVFIGNSPFAYMHKLNDTISAKQIWHREHETLIHQWSGNTSLYSPYLLQDEVYVGLHNFDVRSFGWLKITKNACTVSLDGFAFNFSENEQILAGQMQ